jgi:EmrB/QacA subfamily drug resistance transporter
MSAALNWLFPLSQLFGFADTPRKLVTLGLMIGSFMGSMEATVIATAMPTIVAELGGLNIYGWAFSIYVLTSSAAMPVMGKLSDIFGRRLVYAWAMGLFLLASLLCAVAPSMFWLIVFRGLQGLGAAGLMPLALVMIGDMFTLEERARVQALFSGVWGLSSVSGPLLGGFLVAHIGWPSVFYINIPFGILSAWMVWHWWEDRHELARGKPYIDYPGALLITASAVVLLLGLVDVTRWEGWLAIAASVACASWAVSVERKSPEPIVPVELFDWRLFRMAVLQSIVIGWILNGVTAYVPLFVQKVQGKTPIEAGASLSPLLIAWVVASVISARLLLRTGYWTIMAVGMALVVCGSLPLIWLDSQKSWIYLWMSMAILGLGFGLGVPAVFIAIQMQVERKWMGAATALLQFARNMGGSVGIGVMGAVFNLREKAQGFDRALESVFFVAAIVTILGLAIVAASPRLSPQELKQRRGEAA